MHIQSIFSSKFRDGLGLTESGKVLIDACVVGLLAIRSPFDIALFIVPIIVNAIQRVFIGRSIANHIVEFFKGIKSKFDSAPPIPIIFRVFGISTPLSSFRIGVHFWRTLANPRMSMPRAFEDFQFIASTRFCLSSEQGRGHGGQSVSAITKYVPHRVASFITSCIANNKKTAKPLSCEKTEVWRYSFTTVIANGKFVDSHDAKDTPLVDLVRAVRGVYLFQPAYIVA